MQDDTQAHQDVTAAPPHDVGPVMDVAVMESIACLRAIIASQQRQISRIAQVVALMSGDAEIARRVQEIRAEEEIRGAAPAPAGKASHLKVVK